MSPLILILYIYKLNYILGSNVNNLQFADDFAVYLAGTNAHDLTKKLNNALQQLQTYFAYLNLKINSDKSKEVIFINLDPLM